MAARGGGAAAATAAAAGSAAGATISEALTAFRKRYLAERTPLLAVVDSLLVLAIVVSVIQLGYCALVGTFPFNSFLSGFAASLGVFVLTGEPRA